MLKSEYYKYVLNGEIKNVGSIQEFIFKGTDSRGFPFSFQMSPIVPNSTARDIPESVDADRVMMYLGSVPEKIRDLGTEIEISIGNKPETYKIDSSAVVYVPRGQAYRESVTRQPDKTSWLYSITLPPKYVEPEQPST
jgi:hypothetical protein